LLDGAAPIEAMVSRARELNMAHLALTDHGNMFGALKFYKECKSQGINPIIGCEFYMAPESRFIKTGTEKGNKYHHLILLAKNYTGYRNLIDLCTLSYTEGFYYKPRIDEELLKKYSEGLICLTGCVAGEIPRLILEGNTEAAKKKALFYREIFGDKNFYLELQYHGLDEEKLVNRSLVEISRQTQIPMAATNDIHYIKREDASAQDTLICIGTNKKKKELNRLSFGPEEFYLKSIDEMENLFGELPEAMKNTVRIGEMCDLDIDLPGPQLPDYTIPREFSDAGEYLRHLTFMGLRERYGELTREVKDRADYELKVITSMGYTGYFLIVWDFIDYARRNDIPVGPGRGSGAGSLVAYALKITDIDPIKYGLLFERFLNPDRISMPDFDIDFCYEGRQKVIEYVTEKYGVHRVGQIITFGTLKSRAVIRDVARVLDIPYAEADSIAKLVPQGPKINLKSALAMEPRLEELRLKDEVYNELIDTSLRLEGLNRHASTHAAGIVIGKEKLTRYVPLYKDSKTGVISTQYTMEMLEECGLVKMDFLGLKTLTLIKNAQQLIRKRGIDFDIDRIPEDDEKTFRFFGEGKSTCIFQFESPGMQGVLKRAKPNKIEDLIALNALYRPGPMDNIDQFIDAKMGKIPIKYPLPELEPILKETYGVIVYQEQVMEIARIVGGYTLSQADILRKAMSKKKPEEMAKLKKEFIAGACKKGYTKDKAEEIFNLLIPFAGYGFNKSHAAAYSVLAYKTAYLKANYPAEFMAANLTNEINSTDKLSEYITESREMGLTVLPPDINLSDKFFTVVDGKIVYGLVGIKNLGSNAAQHIIERRNQGGPYTSFVDFLERVDLKIINRKVLETIITSGLFDKLENKRAALFHNLDRLIDHVTRKKESEKYGQASLFDSGEMESGQEILIEPVEEWPQVELLRYEKENLGFYFSGHPLDNYKEIWKKITHIDLSKLDRYLTERTYTLLGIIKNLNEKPTRKGKPMAFATLEDYNGSIELILFPNVWEEVRELVTVDSVVGVAGKIDKSRGEPKFRVDEVKKPEELKPNGPAELHIRFISDLLREEPLQQLKAFLIDHHGYCHVYFHIPNSAEKEIIIKASPGMTVSANDNIIEEIRRYPEIQEVWRA